MGFSAAISLPILLLSFGVVSTANASYHVRAHRVNRAFPVILYPINGIESEYNYNPAHLVLPDGTDALLVRCQVRTDRQDPYKAGPSFFALTRRLGSQDDLYLTDIRFDDVTPDHTVFSPVGKPEAFGVEDPRVIHRPKDGLYYMFYSAVAAQPRVWSRLSVATTKNPEDPSGWKRHGPLFSEDLWSKAASVLLAEDTGLDQHVLFWGDKSIHVATSHDMLNWSTNASDSWLSVRPSHFDSYLVEASMEPLRLEDGNWFMLYNSARDGFPSPRPGFSLQYNLGWVILDKNNPLKIIARSETPILTPERKWEIGEGRFFAFVPNVIFVEGWRRLPKSHPEARGHMNSFLIYYGAGDSFVGAAVVHVDTAT